MSYRDEDPHGFIKQLEGEMEVLQTENRALKKEVTRTGIGCVIASILCAVAFFGALMISNQCGKERSMRFDAEKRLSQERFERDCEKAGMSIVQCTSLLQSYEAKRYQEKINP